MNELGNNREGVSTSLTKLNENQLFNEHVLILLRL